jgi:hypothetical protein
VAHRRYKEEDLWPRLAQDKTQAPIPKTTNTKKCSAHAKQVEDPDFKPPNHQKKKKNEIKWKVGLEE